MWKRVVEQNSEILNNAIWMIIENQIEFLYDMEDGWQEFLDNLSQEEYNLFIGKMVDDFWDRDSVWQEIDENITLSAYEFKKQFEDKKDSNI